jgi:hypothetical protein
MARDGSATRRRYNALVIKLSVDFEHPSRLWWESGGQALWDGLTSGFDESSFVLDDDLAASWLAEAARVPGWHDGPEFAPHPINSQTLADDDPDA